jgi:GNAT superfamily N-acetyltransferase
VSRSAFVERSAPIHRSPRVLQLEGQFDIDAADKTSRSWSVELPVDEREWSIGAFIGPSGSGKTTLMCELFGPPSTLEWRADRAVVDDFPADLGIMDVTGVLSSVGFSSPPAWLRPFDTLSNGEKFRAEIARVIVESDLAVVDEFTSVVDRTVAKIGSHAVAKFVRARGKQLVVASCHFDIVDWLQPDWVYDTGAGEFSWRSLQRRPDVPLEVYRSTTEAWRWFSHHHYLSNKLAPSAQCYVALVDGSPAAFIGVLPVPGIVGMRRASRAVTLPDFQGIGLGNWMIGYVGSLYRAQGFRYTATMSHPAFIHHLARSSEWRMLRRPSRVGRKGRTSKLDGYKESSRRFTASFEYVGPAGDPDAAHELQIPERTPVRPSL